MSRNAAVYCRISQDDGSAKGVKRQQSDCEALVERKGWILGDVYIDNDVSAFSGKTRPQYERMLADIEAGKVDAITAWHPDRLHRSPKELERFIDTVEHAGAVVATCTAGDIDLGTPDGRLMARIVGAVARKESEDKSRRIRRKHLELAQEGKVGGGGRRPFGYEADRLTIRFSEAKEIADAASRVLAGESLRSIVRDWNERGIPTVTGAEWQSTTVKRLLTSGRISGQREHQGRIIGEAEWPAIIEPDETLRLRAILNDPARNRATRPDATYEYLLTGRVVCGRCGAKMTTRPVIRKGHRYPRYVCAADRGGCGRCGIGAKPLDEMVVDNVFAVLDTPKLAKKVAQRRKRKTTPTADLAELERRLDELAEMFSAGEISRREWSTARAGIDQRIADAHREAAAETRGEAADVFVGNGGALQAAWPDLTLDQRRAIIAAVIDEIVIAPTTKANNKFDAGRASTKWKV